MSDWTMCVQTNGDCIRTRTILQEPSGGGRQCEGNLSETCQVEDCCKPGNYEYR